MRNSKLKWIVLAVTLAAAGLVVVACGSSSSSSSGGSSGSGGSTAPGVTATSITFGSHQPLTGPAAPGYSEIAPASQAFFNYVNAHGGVNGRKLQLIYKDDAYNPTNTVNVVHHVGTPGVPTETMLALRAASNAGQRDLFSLGA